jgi:hypothetical protein
MQVAANDPVDADATAGGSERGVRPASLLVRWTAVAAIAVALLLAFALSAVAEELTGKVVLVADGDTVTILARLNWGNLEHKHAVVVEQHVEDQRSHWIPLMPNYQ